MSDSAPFANHKPIADEVKGLVDQFLKALPLIDDAEKELKRTKTKSDNVRELFLGAKERFTDRRTEAGKIALAIKTIVLANPEVFKYKWTVFCAEEMKRSEGDVRRLILIAEGKKTKEQADAENAKDQRNSRIKKLTKILDGGGKEVWAKAAISATKGDEAREAMTKVLDGCGIELPGKLNAEELGAILYQLDMERNNLAVLVSKIVQKLKQAEKDATPLVADAHPLEVMESAITAALGKDAAAKIRYSKPIVA